VTPWEDPELLDRSADGDQAAFTVLMQRHADSVFRFLRSLGADRSDAEDALQDCFVSAWRGAAGFRGPGSARPWLLSIARHALLRQHRRRVGEPKELESLEALGARAGWGSSTDFGPRFEARETLAWALDQIPAQERQVLVLRDLEGFSGHEAAEALGLGMAAMKSRLHRARLRLMSVARSLEETDA